MSSLDSRRIFEFDFIRTIGILAILWGHAGLPGIPGAFLFVDTFFVISGFLITLSFLKIYIHGEESHGAGPAIRGFLARRIRRIIPTLLIALVLFLAVGWFVLLPLDLIELSNASIATAFLIGNLHAASLGDYFAIPASSAPLLHTWSLSLEEQFYLITPIMLLPLAYFKHSHWTFVLIILAILSVTIGTEMSFKGENEAYFAFKTRLWQFLLGIIVALLVRQPRIKLTENFDAGFGILGGVVFITAIFTFTKDMPTPSVLTVIPLVGLCLYIYFKPQSRRMNHFFQWNGFQLVGRSIYGIYLIHFPIMAFIEYRGIHFGDAHKFWMFVLSFLGGMCFSFTVEKIRAEWRDIHFGKVAGLSVFLIIVLLVANQRIQSTGGEMARLPVQAQKFYAGALDVNPHRKMCISESDILRHGYSCEFDFGHAKTVVLIGDSHSDAIASAFIDRFRHAGVNIVHLWYAGCPPINNLPIRAELFSDECTKFKKEAFTYILENPDLSAVFLSARWTWYFEGKPFAKDAKELRFHQADWLPNGQKSPQGYTTMDAWKAEMSNAFARTVAAIKEKGKDVYIFEPIPEMHKNVPVYLAKNAWYEREIEPVTSSFTQYIDYNSYVLQLLKKLESQGLTAIIASSGALCGRDANGLCFGHVEDKTYYYDSNHLNNTGAKLLLNWAFPDAKLGPNSVRPNKDI